MRWEAEEARAHRTRSPHDFARTLAQRFAALALPAPAGMLAARALGRTAFLAYDLVKLVEDLLILRDGDREGLRLALTGLRAWRAEAAGALLDLQAPLGELLAAGLKEPSGPPAEEAPLLAAEAQGKAEGRASRWQEVVQRLHLKLVPAGIPETPAHALARDIGDTYEELLHALRGLHLLLQGDLRPGQVLDILAELQAALTLHVLPNHLGQLMERRAGEVRPAMGARLDLILAALGGDAIWG